MLGGGKDDSKNQAARGAKAKAPPPKKGPGAKGTELSAQDQEKLNNQNEMTKCKDMMQKYKEKLVLLKEQRERFNAYLLIEDVKVDIVDKLGERKFMNTKQDQNANTFLTDKGVYYLGRLKKTEEGDEDIELLTVDGYAVRTAEEDETATDDGAPVLKKDDKKAKKRK